MSHIIFLVVVLVDLSSARTAKDTTLSCPAHQPCKTAFLTYNPVTLKCEGKPEKGLISWQYVDLFQPHAKAVTFIQSSGSAPKNKWGQLKALDLMSRSRLVFGDLRMMSPKVEDTGVYTCKDGEKSLAYYEVDFQDAEQIYVSHASLGQPVQPNTTVDFGDEGAVKMFTLWTAWQPCDRCTALGERKKVGFCFAQISKDLVLSEVPVPCGLLRSSFGQMPLNHKPELRIETCKETCDANPSRSEKSPSLVLDNYHTFLHADLLLKCPASSIYRPVYWEHGNESLTRLQQLTEKRSYVLDDTTGGGTLYIPILNKSDEGIYTCFVDRVPTGKFHVVAPDTQYTEVHQSYSVTDAMIIGISIFLVSLMVLSIFQGCRRIANSRVIH